MKNYGKSILLINPRSMVLDHGKTIGAALRPKHWIKNLFIFSPLLFSGHFRFLDDVYLTVWSFGIFCLSASSVYLFNDIVDKDRDAQSQAHSSRPIAAGKLSVVSAATAGLALQACALTLAYLVSVKLLFFVVLYVANNLLYTLYIKNKVIADVISIAIGFVLRILAGGAVIHVEVSHWLLICTFNVSLLLGFGKRRAELFHAKLVRSVNEIYTENKLDYMISVSAAVTLLSYMLYAVSPENITRFGGHYLVYTVPFVVYGIFRYVAKIQEGKCRDPIHLIYSDKVFVLNMLLWMMAISLILLNAYRQ